MKYKWIVRNFIVIWCFFFFLFKWNRKRKHINKQFRFIWSNSHYFIFSNCIIIFMCVYYNFYVHLYITQFASMCIFSLRSPSYARNMRWMKIPHIVFDVCALNCVDEATLDSIKNENNNLIIYSYLEQIQVYVSV